MLYCRCTFFCVALSSIMWVSWERVNSFFVSSPSTLFMFVCTSYSHSCFTVCLSIFLSHIFLPALMSFSLSLFLHVTVVFILHFRYLFHYLFLSSRWNSLSHSTYLQLQLDLSFSRSFFVSFRQRPFLSLSKFIFFFLTLWSFSF